MKIGDSPSRNTLTIVFSKSYNAFEGRIYFRESFSRYGLRSFARYAGCDAERVTLALHRVRLSTEEQV
jgi:hypothetical protein